MTIGIDIRMLARGARTGVEEYTINLLSNMLCLDKNVKYKLFYNGYQKMELNYDWLKLPNVELMQFRMPNRVLDISSHFLNHPKLDKLLKGVDLFFSPHIFLSSVSGKCKTVTTFHDLSFEMYPEFYSAGKSYWHFSVNPKKQAEKADRIIAVSQSTKDDLVKFYGIESSKIKVIYSGVDDESKIVDSELRILEVRKKYNLPEKYILYLGTLEPRKNIIGLIKAFELFKKRNPPSPLFQRGSCVPSLSKGVRGISGVKLVIAGSKGWLYKDIFKVANSSFVKDDIIFAGFINDQDKPILYNSAELFVYPSFYEGFGFPPLEAMLCGVPVITSNFSSLPEAVGDAAVMVDPYNLDELAEAMQMVLADDKLRNILIQKGFERVKKFNWKKCAEETLEVLKSIK